MKNINEYKELFEEDFEEEFKDDRNFWIVENMGDDRFYFTLKDKIKPGRKINGKWYYDYEYKVLYLDKDKVSFNRGYTISTNSALPINKKKIWEILHGHRVGNFMDKQKVCYVSILNGVHSKNLSEICDILNFDINEVSFLIRR